MKKEKGMKPYMVIEGNNLSLETFEKKVADALELGYSLAGELIAHPQGTEVRFYQPLILAEDSDEDWDDEEEDEEDES
jgi:hypothetical protein